MSQSSEVLKGICLLRVSEKPEIIIWLQDSGAMMQNCFSVRIIFKDHFSNTIILQSDQKKKKRDIANAFIKTRCHECHMLL